MDREQLAQHLNEAAHRSRRATEGSDESEVNTDTRLAIAHSLVAIAHLLNEIVTPGKQAGSTRYPGSVGVHVEGTVRTESAY